MDDDRGARTAKQVRFGEPVGGGFQERSTVLADLQRGQVATSVLTLGHEVPARGQEVTGRTTGRSGGVGFTLAHRVDVHTMEAGAQLTGPGGLNGDRHVALVELELRGGDLGAGRSVQLRGEAIGSALFARRPSARRRR